MRVAIYTRVSTIDQSTANQLLELQRWAKNAGHKVVAVYEDQGISGAKGRDKRPAFDALLKGAVRREFDIVAAWAVDRLGRSMRNLVETLEELKSKRIHLFLHQQALDTTTPSGEAMFGMLSVFAQFERAMIRERVNAGLARARANGKTLGRRRKNKWDVETVRGALSDGMSVRQAARATGASIGAIAKVRKEMGLAH